MTDAYPPQGADSIDLDPWVAIELSNYPPTLNRDAVLAIFDGFLISPEFVLPASVKFAYPFRTTLWIAGLAEAQCAVKELDGSLVEERKICVKIVDEASYEEREHDTRELANELKIAITNAAQIYNPQHSGKILEVRELVQGTHHYAFLQGREPVTVHSNHTAHLALSDNMVKWELLATGAVEVRKDSKSGGSVAALRNLLATVETQSAAVRVWEQWEGSRILDHEIVIPGEGDVSAEREGLIDMKVKHEETGGDLDFDMHKAGSAI